MSTATFTGKWMKKCANSFLNVLTFTIFFFFDFLDVILCFFYRYLDLLFEGKASACYCVNRGQGDDEVSETLYERKNVIREIGFPRIPRKLECTEKINGRGCGGGEWVRKTSRWTDCGCKSCLSWMKNDVDQNLHVVVKEHPKDFGAEYAENVIFIHGFLSSSSFWTETVFKNLSEPMKNQSYCLFALDLLGFGSSPKPRESMYTLREHVEMIEKSVIHPYGLNSFHLVAHSMGCIVAVALAAKYSKFVKSVTLVATPYVPSSRNMTSSAALHILAGKRLWPPLAFGSAVMSWYEHVGRCVCFFMCRNHRTWERILKLLIRKRDLHFSITSLTMHTHHSAWHSMHNVICGGAKYMDDYLKTLRKSGVRLCIIHGDQDQTVPIECSYDLQKLFPESEMKLIRNAGHGTVIVGREKDFVKSLEHIWASS